MIRTEITDAHGTSESIIAKWNMIDIKHRADKFDEKSITREQSTVYHK